MEINRSILIVEVDGKLYQVALQQERMKMLVSLAASLSDNGKINLMPDPCETIAFPTQ